MTLIAGATATPAPAALRLAKRQYMRRVRDERKLLCVGVDLPIDTGTCGRFVHAGYQRCVQLHEALLVAAQARVQRGGGFRRRCA